MRKNKQLNSYFLYYYTFFCENNKFKETSIHSFLNMIEHLKQKLHTNQHELDKINDAPYFMPILDTVKVIKVYDGDTFHVLGKPENANQIYKFVVRLRDIDAPEIKNVQEHDKAIEVRDELASLILNKQIQLSNIGKDKYGRLLCNATIDKVDISQWLLSRNCGYIYHGGKKKEWDQIDH